MRVSLGNRSSPQDGCGRSDRAAGGYHVGVFAMDGDPGSHVPKGAAAGFAEQVAG